MFSFCTLPTLLIRLAVEFFLLLVALLVVLPKHRKAGLVMATGAILDLVVGLGVPTMEMLGLGFWSAYHDPSNGDADLMIVAFLMLPMLAPLAQAFNLTCFLVSVVMLANRLPEEERERPW